MKRIIKKNLKSQQGAVLIGIVVSIIIIASIGTAIISFTSSSTRVQIGSIHTINAYFLAESGYNYAMTYIKDHAATNPIPLLTGKTFTLTGNNEKFRLTLTDNGSCGTTNPVCAYTLVSTGIPNTTSQRAVTYLIEPDK